MVVAVACAAFYAFLPTPAHTPPTDELFNRGVPVADSAFFRISPPCTHASNRRVIHVGVRGGRIHPVVRGIRRSTNQKNAGTKYETHCEDKLGLSPSSHNLGVFIYLFYFILPYGMYSIAYSISVEETENEDRYY